MIGRALPLCVLAGCSNLLGIQELRPAGDAGPGADAESNDGAGDGGAVGPAITVSGRAIAFKTAQMTPCDCAVELRQRTTGVRLARVLTTAATGAYTLSTPSGGMPVDALLEVSDNDATRAIAPSMYDPVEPLRADRTLQIYLFDDFSRTGLASLAGEPAQSVDVLVEVFVVDAERKPVIGAVVSTEQNATLSGRVHYADGSQNPTKTGTSTAGDGVAWVFGLQPGATTTVRVSKPGLTFAARLVGALGGWTTFVEIGPGPSTP